MMEWRDPHYQEWAVAEAGSSGKWVGKVKGRKEAPAQAMTVDETTETLWTSDPCNSKEKALQLARERVEAGGPWDS